MFRWFHLCRPATATSAISFFNIELTRDYAIRFKDLEFIVEQLDNLFLLPEGDDSSAVVGGMAHSGSPSLHAILEESPSEDDSTSSEGESFGSPIPMVCTVVTYATPIVTTLLPEETLAHQTIPVVPQQVSIPRSNTRPLHEQPMARQEERRCARHYDIKLKAAQRRGELTDDVIPHSEIAGTKPPYVCPRCFIHTYSNNMINRFHVQ
jgi:hypothetical protein